MDVRRPIGHFPLGTRAVPAQSNKLYGGSIEGGLPEALPVTRTAFGELSPDGQYLAYTPIAF